jgi:hypothetical protein
MSNDQTTQQQPAQQPAQDQHSADTQAQQQEAAQALNEIDGLADKKPEELTPEELRLMADTMPGEGPGD